MELKIGKAMVNLRKELLLLAGLATFAVFGGFQIHDKNYGELALRSSEVSYTQSGDEIRKEIYGNPMFIKFESRTYVYSELVRSYQIN